MKDRVTVSVPGSMMILGEHAVLRGKRALACAIDKRITVEASINSGDKLEISSELGSYSSALNKLNPAKQFSFVLAAVEASSLPPERGIALKIESEFSHQVGFGSSAAVTVGVLKALSMLKGEEIAAKQLIERGTKVIRSVQGLGSGTDVAASVLGGVVLYRQTPQEFKNYKTDIPISVAYSGAKTPTAEVVRLVNEWEAKDHERYAAIFDSIDKSIDAAVKALEDEDLPALGQILNLNQSFMEEIGVSSERLSELVSMFRGQADVHGAKISGSGLGDCVLALGHYSGNEDCLIQVCVDPDGVICLE